jgi:hypothetical protein
VPSIIKQIEVVAAIGAAANRPSRARDPRELGVALREREPEEEEQREREQPRRERDPDRRSAREQAQRVQTREQEHVDSSIRFTYSE